VNELIGIMERAIGRRAKVKYTEKQKGDVRDTWADVSKAEKVLGWMPKTKIEEGLKKYIPWLSEIGI
jgi:nucleoside-diphosphate-sugar epimerase